MNAAPTHHRARIDDRILSLDWPTQVTLIGILEHHPAQFTLLGHPESSNHPPASELSELQKVNRDCQPDAGRIRSDQNTEHLISLRQLEGSPLCIAPRIQRRTKNGLCCALEFATKGRCRPVRAWMLFMNLRHRCTRSPPMAPVA